MEAEERWRRETLAAEERYREARRIEAERNGRHLQELIARTQPGDHIVLDAGQIYRGEFVLRKQCEVIDLGGGSIIITGGKDTTK
jgi:hypothetical protein